MLELPPHTKTWNLHAPHHRLALVENIRSGSQDGAARRLYDGHVAHRRAALADEHCEIPSLDELSRLECERTLRRAHDGEAEHGGEMNLRAARWLHSQSLSLGLFAKPAGLLSWTIDMIPLWAEMERACSVPPNDQRSTVLVRTRSQAQQRGRAHVRKANRSMLQLLHRWPPH